MVNPPDYDFGAVGQTELLSAEFRVTNNYRHPFHITRVAGSCSCVGLKADDLEVAPGQATTIRVGWRTHGKTGRVTDHFGIHYTAGSEFDIRTVRLMAVVAPDITSQPDVVRFGGSRPAEQIVSFRHRIPSTSVSVTSGHCSAEAVAVTPTADGHGVVLRYNPAGLVKPGIKHQLLVRLATAEQQLMELPVVFEPFEHPVGSQP